MRLRTKLLLAVAGLFIAASATAQIAQNAVTGNEVWVAAQTPGGPGTFIGINTVRNGRAMVLKSGTGAATSTAAGGTLFWVGTAPTTWAVTLPSPAFDGEIVSLATDTTLTSMVTVTPGAGQTADFTYSAVTLTAATSNAFQYSVPTAVWYRLN